jgi:Gram-negative bacterial TonB protein C-terminal
MRRGVLYLGAACLAGWLAWHYGVVSWPHGAAMPALPVPEDGMVVEGAYRSEYFGLTYPLPQGWMAGASGPAPSQFGDYVLSTLVPEGEMAGTILITAQDLFFAAEPYKDAAAMADDFRRSVSEIAGMTIDREPSELRIAGRLVHRVDFSGVGLHRAMFVFEIRCHLLRFNLTARDPEMLASLALSLDDLSFAGKSDAASSEPVCLKDYADAETLLQKVAPLPVGPAFTPIPVRIIIAADGGVKQVHVIRATPDQRHSIEDALRQWKFRPYVVDGRAVEVETGLLFRFTPEGR